MRIIGYLIVIAVVIFVEVKRRREFFVDSLTFFHLFFVLDYAISPIYVFYTNSSLLMAYPFRAYDSNYWYTPYLLLIAYLCFLLGFRLALSRGNRIGPRYWIDQKALYRIFKVGLILYVAAVILYVQAFGGLKQAMTMGTLSRYGYEIVNLGPTAFAKNILPLGPLLLFFCYYELFLERIRIDRAKWYILFTTLIMLVTISCVVLSGRGYIVGILLTIAFMNTVYHDRVPRGKVMVFAIVLILIISYGKQAFFGISAFMTNGLVGFRGAFLELNAGRMLDSTVLDSFFKESANSIVSFENALSTAGEALPYTYFVDFAWSILRIIPQKLVLLFIEPPLTISAINTYLLTNKPIASIPPGLLGHCVYAGGTFGMLLGMFCYGALGGILQNSFSVLNAKNNITIVFYAIFCTTYGGFIGNGDPNVYIYSLIFPTLCWLSIWQYAKKPPTIGFRQTVRASHNNYIAQSSTEIN